MKPLENKKHYKLKGLTVRYLPHPSSLHVQKATIRPSAATVVIVIIIITKSCSIMICDMIVNIQRLLKNDK